jgi:hypothetical protein
MQESEQSSAEVKLGLMFRRIYFHAKAPGKQRRKAAKFNYTPLCIALYSFA